MLNISPYYSPDGLIKLDYADVLNAQKLKVIQEIETNDLSTKTIESETIETETIETTTQNATYSNIENANITNLNVTSEENINIQTTQILGLNGIIMINDNELTASAHQLNYNDISVEGQAENNRVLVLDENKNISGINNILCSNISGTILTQSQPNITSVGTLSSLNVTNNISCSNISGIILTQSQPNISHVGTLDELKVNSLGIINLYGSRITITSDIIPLGIYNGIMERVPKAPFSMVPGRQKNRERHRQTKRGRQRQRERDQERQRDTHRHRHRQNHEREWRAPKCRERAWATRSEN